LQAVGAAERGGRRQRPAASGGGLADEPDLGFWCTAKGAECIYAKRAGRRSHWRQRLRRRCGEAGGRRGGTVLELR
jgi:hypothetical protein